MRERREMYNDYDYGPAPIDSYGLYAMGLRAPRCNGCRYAERKGQPLKESVRTRAMKKGEQDE